MREEREGKEGREEGKKKKRERATVSFAENEKVKL